MYPTHCLLTPLAKAAPPIAAGEITTAPKIAIILFSIIIPPGFTFNQKSYMHIIEILRKCEEHLLLSFFVYL